MLKGIADTKKSPVVVSTQLPCVCLSLTARQAAFAVTSTAYGLCVVDGSLATQPLVVGVAQALFGGYAIP